MGKVADAAEWVETQRFKWLALLGAVLVAVPAMLVDWENAWCFSLLMLLLVVAGAGITVFATSKEGASHQKEIENLKERIDEAAGAVQVYYRTIMLPTIEKLHTFLKASGPTKRAGTFESLLGQVLGDAMGFLGGSDSNSKEVRVNYYRLGLDEDGLPCLDVVGNTRDVERQRIDTSDAGGRQIVLRTLKGESEYCPDLAKRPTFANSAGGRYACFVSVSVRSNGYVYGMISANTETIEGIPPNAEDYLKVVAGIMAIAENLLESALKSPINKGITFKQLEKMRDNGMNL